MDGIGQAIANGIMTLVCIAFVVGGAAFWLASFLWRHIDVSVRWIP